MDKQLEDILAKIGFVYLILLAFTYDNAFGRFLLWLLAALPVILVFLYIIIDIITNRK